MYYIENNMVTHTMRKEENIIFQLFDLANHFI